MYVPGVHKLASNNSAASQKLKNASDFFGSAEKHKDGTIVERYLEDWQNQVRLHEQEFTRPDME